MFVLLLFKRKNISYTVYIEGSDTMELIYGRPFQGAMLEALKAFLLADGLRYDEGVEFTVCVMDGDKIAATGSLDGKICKCIAVSPAYQGEGLSATVLTALRKEAFDRDRMPANAVAIPDPGVRNGFPHLR